MLANTKAPAILIELGFIDNEADMAKWNPDKIANSIVYALTGQSGGTPPPPSKKISSNQELFHHMKRLMLWGLTSLK